MSVLPRLLVALLAPLGLAPAAAAERYLIDERHTFPVFEVSHFGFSTQRGRFNRVSGSIELDREARSGRIDITVDTASIDMGLEDWDAEMRSERFFNSAAYPSMIYRAEEIRFEGERPVAALGRLALLGVVQPLTLHFSSFKCAVELATRREKCGADATATFRRSAFGMDRYVPFIGDEVRLLIPVEAYRVDAAPAPAPAPEPAPGPAAERGPDHLGGAGNSTTGPATAVPGGT